MSKHHCPEIVEETMSQDREQIEVKAISRKFDGIDAVLNHIHNCVYMAKFALSLEDWEACAEIHKELVELFSTLEEHKVVQANNVYSDQS